MRAFELSDKGDLIFNGTELVMTEGLHQIAQEMELSVGTAKGEWFLDEDEGMDYSSLYDQRPFNKDEFRNDAIESLDGTTQPLIVTELLIGKPIGRSVKVELKAETEDGELIQINDLEVST